MAVASDAWPAQTGFSVFLDTTRPTKAVEILLNSMRLAHLPAAPLAAAIRGAVLLEIGCGRHIGFASFSLGLGAKNYIGVDPALDVELLRHLSVARHYLSPALHAAKKLAAGLPEFQHLPFALGDAGEVGEMLARCHLVQGGVADLTQHQEKVDICVSVSCLEHIRDFAQAARVMASLSHSETIHVHVVNFSSHLSKQRPFGNPP